MHHRSVRLLILVRDSASKPVIARRGLDVHRVQAWDVVRHILVLGDPAHARIDLPDDVVEILSSLAEAAGARAVGTLAEISPPGGVEDELAVDAGSQLDHRVRQVVHGDDLASLRRILLGFLLGALGLLGDTIVVEVLLVAVIALEELLGLALLLDVIEFVHQNY